MENSLSRETKVFLGFFVPERKQDDLNKTNTLWRVFLDAGNRRYEGKVEKMKAQFAEVNSLYPHFSRFSTPYIVTFPVPVSMVENGNSKLTITGPPGSTSVEFKPTK